MLWQRQIQRNTLGGGNIQSHAKQAEIARCALAAEGFVVLGGSD